MGNTYVLYVVVMLLIGVFAGLAIAGLNFSLSVAKKFVAGGWRYRLVVVVVLGICGAAVAGVFVHWITTPDF